MDIGTLAVEAFGICSLSIAFAKYTVEKRKATNAAADNENNRLRKAYMEGASKSP